MLKIDFSSYITSKASRSTMVNIYILLKPYLSDSYQLHIAINIFKRKYGLLLESPEFRLAASRVFIPIFDYESCLQLW